MHKVAGHGRGPGGIVGDACEVHAQEEYRRVLSGDDVEYRRILRETHTQAAERGPEGRSRS